MDVGEVMGACWRQRALVLLALVVGALVLGAGGRLAPGTFPSSYDDPGLPWAVVVTVVVALVVGVGLAVARDARTRTVDGATDAEAASLAPLLAHVVAPADLTTLPALSGGTRGAGAFAHLRTAVEREGARSDRLLVVVAGLRADDLGVWVGANLALTLASAPGGVLLVDGRMGGRFGQPAEAPPDSPGLFEVLAGEPLDAALVPGPVPGLEVLAAGAEGEDGTSIDALLRRRFASLVAPATAGHRAVVVLAPPVDLCEDAVVMAAHGSLVLAVPGRRVARSVLRRHADRVRGAGAALLGVVLVDPAAADDPAPESVP